MVAPSSFSFQTPFDSIAKGMFSVIGDGGVKKRVKKVGSGEVIQEGMTATCK